MAGLGLTKTLNKFGLIAKQGHLIRAVTKPVFILSPGDHNVTQTRNKGKHWNPKFKKERAAKVLKVDLPKFVELKKDRPLRMSEKTSDEIRMELKKEGRLPPRSAQVLPIDISCTRSIVDPYEPKPGDGRQTEILASGLADYTGKVTEKAKRGVRGVKDRRTLKKYEDFVEKDFAEVAQRIVIETNTLLQDVLKNQDRLHELVTEEAFPKMVHGLETKSMRWTFVETVEAPTVVRVRTEEVMAKENVFAQVTVRMHTKQILAIYDRFGRLMFGDPQLAKSVVEYIVMEKWITDTYGTWRIHGKILPRDAPPKGVLVKTYRVPNFEPLPPLEEETKDETAPAALEGGKATGQATPALA